MTKKRPLGVTAIAALLVLFGGALILMMLFEIIDSLRLFGFASLLVPTPLAFLGFLVYAGIPVTFYSTGVGLFMGRAWARKSTLWVLPTLLFLFFMNFACKIVQEELQITSAPALELFIYRPGVFLGMFFRCLLIIWPLLTYFNNTHIQFYFLQDE